MGFVVVVAGLAGCGTSGIQLTRERAAFDLSCPQDKLNVEVLTGNEYNAGATFGVRGCGKKATYIRKDEGGTTLDSPIQEDK
jgi:hypothetical protein